MLLKKMADGCSCFIAFQSLFDFEYTHPDVVKIILFRFSPTRAMVMAMSKVLGRHLPHLDARRIKYAPIG